MDENEEKKKDPRDRRLDRVGVVARVLLVAVAAGMTMHIALRLHTWGDRSVPAVLFAMVVTTVLIARMWEHRCWEILQTWKESNDNIRVSMRKERAAERKPLTAPLTIEMKRDEVCDALYDWAAKHRLPPVDGVSHAHVSFDPMRGVAIIALHPGPSLGPPTFTLTTPSDKKKLDEKPN